MTTETPDQTQGLLHAVATVTLPASGEFPIRERFERPAGVRFSTVWTEFKKRFYGKVEAPCGEAVLRKYSLTRISPDGPIIADLGGESRAEGRIAWAHALIRAQARGEEGILQTNGYANIFYARDAKEVLCAVRIGWDGEGWVIDAIPVADPLAWNGKHEIFCPA